MATLKKLNYPNSLDVVVGYNTGLPPNNLLPSKSPIYSVLKAKESTYQDVSLGTPIPNDTIYFNIHIRDIYTVGEPATDVFFYINGIKYSNTTIVNGKNLFLKSTNQNDVLNSLSNMFRLNGFLEGYDITATGLISTFGVEMTLTSKVSGRSNYIDVSNLVVSSAADQYYINTFITSPYFLRTNMVITKSIGKDISQDVDNYEIGLDIYKFQTSLLPRNEYITSVSKKGFGLVDFDLSNIFDNSLEKWKPTINNFNINNNKYLEIFRLTLWQKWVDKQEDPNNTFANIYYNGIQYFEIIDAREPLFQKINYDLNTLNQTSQPNYLEDHAGTYGVYDPSYIDTQIYDKNLTNQPSNKQMNRSFELLSNVNRNYLLETGQTLNDRVVFKFTYNDNFTETVVLNNNNTFQGANRSYINQLSFKIDTLSSYTTSGLSMTNLKYLDVHFETDTYNSNIPVVFETQRYFIDSTVQNCNDTEVDIDYIPFVFKNGKGAFDLFEFTTVQEINTNRAIQTIDTPYTWQNKKTSEFTKIWDTQYDKQYATKTRVLTNEEFIWMEDFVKSEEVYILDILTNDLYPVIVLSTSYNYKQNQDNVINITYRFSRPEVV